MPTRPNSRSSSRPSSRSNSRPPDRGPRVDLLDLVDFITRSLVEFPDEVEVTLVEERDADVYEIEVGDEDLGKIIGRGGKTARAIRTVVNAVAPRSGKRTLVEILE
jgi:uncharacterized protein